VLHGSGRRRLVQVEFLRLSMVDVEMPPREVGWELLTREDGREAGREEVAGTLWFAWIRKYLPRWWS
jgi:hypothetical protein